MILLVVCLAVVIAIVTAVAFSWLGLQLTRRR
jgi:hypothetical protein